tara:strand:+ start:224 stop:502 length:279 start_codon:yes stop_codon:yes gene_type:complete
MRLQHLKQQTLANSEVRAEYYQLENEFAFIDQLLSMRAQAGLTQEQLEKCMHTQKSNISRLKRGNFNPSWTTLLKYAHACGFELNLMPQKMS